LHKQVHLHFEEAVMGNIQVDFVIIGGGIAGLWLLNRLRQLNVSVILLESGALGGAQTHKAQGIIHGGMKYALSGQLTSAAQAIAKMPAVWKACLEGQGEIDLSKVSVLSKQQYLWSTGSLTSKMASFFAGLTLKSDTKSLDKKDFPAIFQHPQFQGQVYSLNEIVIDVHALLRELTRAHEEFIFKIDPMEESHLELDENDHIKSLTIQSESRTLQINAKKFIFTAGSGNELLLRKLKHHTIGAQRRPLHMVIVKHHFTYPVYAHCLGLSATPRLTITTHQAKDGKSIWYIGGQIAEEGVKLSSENQILKMRKELKELFSWLDFSEAEFASFYIDRAESLQPNHTRPDTCSVQEIGNILVAWPIKLAFAPLLTNEILRYLTPSFIQPNAINKRAFNAWPAPLLAQPIWDQLLP
jgi:glycerol-3-phosphate dehydrogenase